MKKLSLPLSKKPARRVIVLREKSLEQVTGGIAMPTGPNPLDPIEPEGWRPQGAGRDWIWE